MKLLAGIVALPFLTFVILAWHEATEQHEPGGIDDGDGWRAVAGWILLALYLLLMAAIAAAGSLDYGLLGHLLDRHRQRGRHRRQYADQAAVTFGTRQPDTVRAWDRSGPTLPVVLIPSRTPHEVVLDETETTGGVR